MTGNYIENTWNNKIVSDFYTIKGVLEKAKPDIVIIDSIQTMYNEDVSSAPGSVSQVRETTNVLMQIAKGLGITIFVVGHVTKEGTVAGPRVLEHMVDTVLYIEGIGLRIAEDTGGDIKGNRLDVFVDSKEEAIQKGVKKAKVHIIKGKK